MILPEILSDYKTYAALFFKLKLWRTILSELTCPGATSDCPCCVIGWGSRKRKPRIEGGQQLPPIGIKRLRCKAHRKTFSFLPSFLLPRIQYCAHVVNAVLEGYAIGETIPCLAAKFCINEECTISRWTKRIIAEKESIRQSVMVKMGVEFFTSDERLMKMHSDRIQEPGSRSLFCNLWVLLKIYTERRLDFRLPAHYAFLWCKTLNGSKSRGQTGHT